MGKYFEGGIDFYETDYAQIPVHWPNGERRCAFCYDWFKSKRVDGIDVFWCSLAPLVGQRANHLADPHERPEWCPFKKDEVR